MKIKRLPLESISINCYLISTEKAAIVIDPGFYSSEAQEFLKENASKEKLVLLTHCHFDHIAGAKALREETGVKIAIHQKDAEGLFDPVVNVSSRFGITLAPFKADIIFQNEKIFSLGNTEIEILLTPGHTKGSVCYILEDIIFSGDTLFAGAVGRTDVPGGDFKTLMNSLALIKGKKDREYVVLSGHGGKTTLSQEIISNPYM